MGMKLNLASMADRPRDELRAPTLTSAKLSVPWDRVAPNPVNHRPVGDLSDLESMKRRQVQACTVVTRAAFLRIYPEHEATVGEVDYVAVVGSRRRAAAELYNLATLDIVVDDSCASDRVEFYSTSVIENIDRKGLNVLEEAHALRTLVAECGGIQDEAARRLRRSKTWVSQRLDLLDLVPSLHEELLSGKMPINAAREIAKKPAEDQPAEWRRCRAAAAGRPKRRRRAPADTPGDTAGAASGGRPSVVLLPPAGEPPEVLAELLLQHFDADFLRALTTLLAGKLG